MSDLLDASLLFYGVLLQVEATLSCEDLSRTLYHDNPEEVMCSEVIQKLWSRVVLAADSIAEPFTGWQANTVRFLTFHRRDFALYLDKLRGLPPSELVFRPRLTVGVYSLPFDACEIEGGIFDGGIEPSMTSALRTEDRSLEAVPEPPAENNPSGFREQVRMLKEMFSLLDEDLIIAVLEVPDM